MKYNTRSRTGLEKRRNKHGVYSTFFIKENELKYILWYKNKNQIYYSIIKDDYYHQQFKQDFEKLTFNMFKNNFNIKIIEYTSNFFSFL